MVKRKLRKMDDKLDKVLKEENQILAKEDQILSTLEQKHVAHSATLILRTATGDFKMDLQVHITDLPGTAVFQEFDGPSGTGNIVPPVGAVTFASDNPAVATVDPATGKLAYLADGVANISGTDAGNTLTASAALTIIAGAAKSATLTLLAG